MARITDGQKKEYGGRKRAQAPYTAGHEPAGAVRKLETLAVYICRGSISRIEDNQRSITDIELYGLAKVLNVSIEDLFKT